MDPLFCSTCLSGHFTGESLCYVPTSLSRPLYMQLRAEECSLAYFKQGMISLTLSYADVWVQSLDL